MRLWPGRIDYTCIKILNHGPGREYRQRTQCTIFLPQHVNQLNFQIPKVKDCCLPPILVKEINFPPVQYNLFLEKKSSFISHICTYVIPYLKLFIAKQYFSCTLYLSPQYFIYKNSLRECNLRVRGFATKLISQGLFMKKEFLVWCKAGWKYFQFEFFLGDSKFKIQSFLIRNCKIGQSRKLKLNNF